MISNISVKVNGNAYEGIPIKVIPGGFSLFWDYAPAKLSQSNFSLSLGTSSNGHGTDQFIGNVLTVRNSNSPRQNFYFNPSSPLPRNLEIYGQLRIVDNLGDVSSWYTFKIFVNSMPHIVSGFFNPNYGIESGINLNVTLPSDDVYYKIRWYKNGNIQSYLDDSVFVSGRNIDYGDNWYAEILPYDDLENGPIFEIGSINIPKPSLSASSLSIMPSSPNPDDVLQLQYSLTKDGVTQSIGDESLVTWYINGVAVDADYAGPYARLRLAPGDSVYARLTPSWGGFYGEDVFSETILISDYNLSVSEATVSGIGLTNKVSYNSANLVWSVPNNLIDFVSGFSIKVGFSQGGDNVFSTEVSKSSRNFLIPSEVLSKGLNYYVSVAPIGLSGNVGRYDTVFFSTIGDSWSDNVNPMVGYSIMYDISCDYVFDSEYRGDVLSLNVADGSHSFSVEISPVILRLSLGSTEKYQIEVDFTKKRNVIVSVLNNKVYIYVDSILVIQDKTLIETTSRKYLNITPRNNLGDLSVYISSLSLSVKGAFHTAEPSSREYYTFSEVIQMKSRAINDVESTPDGVLFVAEDTLSGYSKLYKYNPYADYLNVNIKNLDTQFFSVNGVAVSANEKAFAIYHSRGCSIFSGNPSVHWDSDTEFLSNDDLINNNWYRFSYLSNQGISFNSDGIYISTLYEDIGVPSNISSNSQYEFPAIAITSKVGIASYVFGISNGFLSINNSDTATYFSYNIDLSQFSVSNLVSYIKSLSATIDGLTYIQDFYNIEILNFAANLSALDLIDFAPDSDGSVVIDILNKQNIIDPNIDNSQSSVTGGKAFISHNSYGTPWVDYVNASTGYSLEFEMKVSSFQDSIRPVNVNSPGVTGVYFNDGLFENSIIVNSSGMFIKDVNKNLSVNLNEFTKIRINAKEGIAKIWKKEITDSEFVFLDSFKQTKLENISRDSKGQKVVSVNGDYHSIWIEESGEYDVIKYSTSVNGEKWSDPISVPTGFVKIKSADIAVNYNNEIFISYETFYSNHSDIFVISKNQYGWSTQFNISDGQGSSADCRVHADEFNNIHLVWSDNRSGIYEIYYAIFNNASRKWDIDGEYFTKVTSSSVGAHSPSLCSRSGVVYISWTDQSSSGLSQIRAAYYNYLTKQWQSSAKSGSDIIVSEVSYSRANRVDTLVDKDGSIHFVWHDYIPSLTYYKILHRVASPFLSFSAQPFLINKSDELVNCFNPKIGMVDSSGDIILVFEKKAQIQDKVIPLPEINTNNQNIFIVEETLQSSSGNLFACRWIRNYRLWASSGGSINANGSTVGGYDSAIINNNSYIKNSVILPKIIIYKPVMLISMKDISNIESYNNSPYLSIYALEFDVSLPSNVISYGQDPYDNFLNQISQSGPFKSLSIGDMSDWNGVGMSVRYLRYSTSGEHEPARFRKIGFMSHTMSSLPIIGAAVADNGDAWIANQKGLYFYNSEYDQVFDAWSETIASQTYLTSILNSNSYEILDFVSDSFSNFFIVIKVEDKISVLVSINHISWSVISFSQNAYEIKNNRNIKIAFNDKGDMVIGQANNSCVIYEYNKYLRSISNSSLANPGSSSSSSGSGSLSMPSVSFTVDRVSNQPFAVTNIDINTLKIDDERNIFAGTDVGLYYGQIDSMSLLTKKDGLSSEIVNDIFVVNNSTRICTFENSISYMNGTSFEDIGIIYVPSVLTENGIVVSSYVPTYFDSGNFVNSQKYNNSILVACKNGLILISDDDPVLKRKLPRSAFFDAQSLDFIPSNISNSFTSKEFKFSIPDYIKTDPNINNFVAEVLINNNLINFGYEFSASQETLVFATSLLPSDKVVIKLRTDIIIENDFSQNNAEVEGFGYQSRAGRLVLQDSGTRYATGGSDDAVEIIRNNYTLVTGTRDYIAMSDPLVKLPYDEITLDLTPPKGKLKFVSQTGPNTVNLTIDPDLTVSGTTEKIYDLTSGMGFMVISNFDNFTSDGSTPLEPVPFSRLFSHDLTSSLSPSNTVYSNRSVNFSKLVVYKADNDSKKLYAITSSPVQIFERSIGGVFDETPIAVLHEGDPDFAVGFAEVLNNVLVIGTRSVSGTNRGSLWTTTDLVSFEQMGIFPGYGATSAFVSSYDRFMYIGVDASNDTDPFGAILRFDGNIVETYKTGIGTSVNCISGLERFIYVGTSPEGKIYRIDLASDVAEISHIDVSPSILSITTLGQAIYAGPSDRGRVIRAKFNSAGFTEAFKTIPSDPSVLKTLDVFEVGDRVFLGISNKVYSFRGTWTLEGSTDDDITDIVVDDNGSVIYCSKHEIKLTKAQTAVVRRVFAKLIDNAGNETVLASSPDDSPTDGYNDNYVVTLTENELRTTYLQSKLIEVNDQGSVLYSIDGDAPFYGGERILKEAGVYLSEIFNGTAGHVSWNRISWEGFVPGDSELKISIRVASSREAVETSPYVFELDKSTTSADISFISGQYLQLKIELATYTNENPYVSRIVVTNNAGSASHFFTTTFPLPSKIKRGIITTEKILPVGSDIVIGINGNEASDFSLYQPVPENRVFTIDSDKRGQGLKVGFRFITQQSNQGTGSGPNAGDLPGYGTILSNSVQFYYLNNSGAAVNVDFKVEFFSDAGLANQIVAVDSITSPSLFRVNGNMFPNSGGISVPPSYNYLIHCIPLDLQLSCDVTYYVRASVVQNNSPSQIGSIIPFIKLCGVNFINNIYFRYANLTNAVQNLHFEVSLYLDEARTNLYKTYGSIAQNASFKFFADFFDYPGGGLILQPNESSLISLEFNASELSSLEADQLYYVTVRYSNMFDDIPSPSVESMNYTFRVSYIDNSIVCGSQAGVPVLQGFAFMFELEDGSLIKFNYIS